MLTAEHYSQAYSQHSLSDLFLGLCRYSQIQILEANINIIRLSNLHKQV